MSPEEVAQTSEELDDASLDELAAPEDGQQDGTSGRRIIHLIVYYHPVAFLAVSIGLAIFACIVFPTKATEPPPPAERLYADGLRFIRRAINPDESLRESSLLKETRGAHVSITDLFRHYRPSIADYPQMINPYMLLAESRRLYFQQDPNVGGKLLEYSYHSYTEALVWEDLNKQNWNERQEALYLSRNFLKRNLLNPNPHMPKAGEADKWQGILDEVDAKRHEIEVRQQRRKQYLLYHRIVTGVKIGRASLLVKDLKSLISELQQEESELDRTEVGGPEPVSISKTQTGRAVFLPVDFELTREDKAALHFHLAQAYEQLKQPDLAEQEYRLFLFRAPRGEKRFTALMRLGAMYMERGQKILVTGVVGAGERSARDYFRAAVDQYGQVIEASAPEIILREAYFRGGTAYLALAEAIEVGKGTWWDAISENTSSVRRMLESFAGRQLPERTGYLADAFGKMLLEEGGGVPDPLSLMVAGVSGAAISLASKERETLQAQKNALLRQAEAFLQGAEEGADHRYHAAARVMIARALLARAERDKSRELLIRIMGDDSTYEIQLASRQGLARALMLDGELVKAKKRFLGGMEKAGSSLFTYGQVNWVKLALRLYARGPQSIASPSRRVWEVLPVDMRDLMRSVAETRRLEADQKKAALEGMNDLLGSRNLYLASAFKGVALPDPAIRLLERDRSLLTGVEVEWLNRMLLESVYGHIFEPHSMDGVAIFAPFPSSQELPVSDLLSRDELILDLRSLSRRFSKRAESFLADGSADMGDTMIPAMRDLENAVAVNEFTMANYARTNPDLMVQTAGLYRQLADLRSKRGEVESAQQLVSKASDTYLKVAIEVPGSIREEDALWEAGRGYYASGQYSKATEALTLYHERHGNSDRAGAAQNLLGRCYWNLGQTNSAIRVFTENAARRTPDGQKSIYYLGLMYLISGLSGEDEEKLGNADKQLPIVGDDGRMQIESALQAFNHIRRIKNLAPDSRPWRWATFDLGLTWYLIAESQRRNELKARKEGKPIRPELWVPLYRKAETHFIEALDRYLLKQPGASADDLGLDVRVEPEDYSEIMCARFVTEYHLGRCLMLMAETQHEPMKRQRARIRFENLINPRLYREVMFDRGINRFLLYSSLAQAVIDESPPSSPAEAMTLSPRSGLGSKEGPTYTASMLYDMRRNAFLLLGQSYLDEGESLRSQAKKLADEGKQKEAGRIRMSSEVLLRASFAVYQRAYDRLSPVDAPQLMYLMGESLRLLNRPREARSRYNLAVNAARSLQIGEPDKYHLIDPKLWETRAAERLRDMKDGF